MRFLIRTFRRGSGTYLFAILVLALGCGISTAVFSLAEAVLLRPLPFRDASALRVIWKANPRTAAPFIELAYPELNDLRQNVTAIESVSVLPTTLYGYGRVLQRAGTQSVQIESTPVSHEFFQTLGTKPAIGRDFRASDEQPGAAPVVILSSAVWRNEFHGDPGIVGRQIRLSGTGYTVIGVMGAAFDFPRGAGMWLPLGVNGLRANRAATYLQAIARLRPGFTDAQLHTQTSALFSRMAREYPGHYSAGQQPVITPLPQYLTGSARSHLLIALFAASLLMAASCFTASNLLVSRTLRRSLEISTRMALGAGTRKIAMQFLAEGAVAAVAAVLLGLVLASGLTRLLVFLAPPDIPGIDQAGLDTGVLAFAAGLTLLITTACSAAPALMANRMGLENQMREGSSRIATSRAGSRIQGLFAFAQTGITAVLLALSLLTVLSVRATLRSDPGYRNRETVTFNLPLRELDGPARKLFYTKLLARLRESPGVIDAGAVLLRPLEGSIGWETHYQPESDTRTTSDLPTSQFEVITPGYFEAVGTPVTEGRNFKTADQANSEPIAIVSRSIADRIRRAGRSPVGSRIRLGAGLKEPWFRIVGVAADSRYRDLTATGDTIYLDYLQTGIPVNYLAVHGKGSAAEITARVREEIARLDPDQATANIATISQLMDANTARARFNMTLLFAFGAGALLLAAAGIFSVAAESVSLRTKEIAIRLALGARRRALIGRLISDQLKYVAMGEAAGLVGAIVAGRAIAHLLYGIGPADPAVLAFVLVLIGLTSVAGAAIPAWRASRMEPQGILQSG